MVGGLIVSQALTLFTTPVIYLYLDRLSEWLSPSRHDREEDKQLLKPGLTVEEHPQAAE
jgi:hypothetical protein